MKIPKKQSKIGKLLQKKWRNIKNIWEKYEKKIVLAIGMILLAVVSFQIGALKGEEWKQKPLVITTPKNTLVEEIAKISNNSNSNLVLGETSVATISNNNENISEENCAFVASKNSKKYHKNDCRWSKRILPKNRVCFKNMEEAKNRGFEPASCLK